MEEIIEFLYDYLEEPNHENKSKIMLYLLELDLSGEQLSYYNEYLNSQINVIHLINDIKKKPKLWSIS